MKIALVILHADPARGGAERYTDELSRSLRSRGQAVSVLSASFTGGIVPPEGVLLPSAGATRVGRYARFLESLENHLAQVRYDVVHAMLPVRACDVYHPHAGVAVEALKSNPLKHAARWERAVSRVGNRINFRRRRFAQVERHLLESNDPPTVLCLSDYVKTSIRRYYDIPDSKLATLFNAVDLTRFDPAMRPTAGAEVRRQFAIPGGRVVALMIAQDFARKGLREAITALSQNADEKLLLLVVGKQDPSPYRKLAADLNLGNRVIFAGPTDDPYLFYRAADFFVLPTRHDPCSLVVLESLAMGVPVISTVFNGACQIMAEGTHGYVLRDPADIPALAQSMSMMLDGDRRRQMSQACLALRPTLSNDQHVERLLEIYRGLESKSSSPQATRAR